MVIDSKSTSLLLQAQKYEISEYYIYKRLAKTAKGENSNVLVSLAESSLKHYQFWEGVTGKKISPSKKRVWFYTSIAKILGLTFGIKMLEQSEEKIRKFYQQITQSNKDWTWIIEEERKHEEYVSTLINEEFLNYVSSIVLGSSDALVELTGTLAGLTFALQNNQLIGATGLITGLSASLSMASSEYLSTKSSESKSKNPLKAALYTGLTYVLTVSFLILPYFVSRNYLFSLALTLLNAAIVILFFAFYLSITKGISFKQRLAENLFLSFGVAFLSFIVGVLVKKFLNLEV